MHHTLASIMEFLSGKGGCMALDIKEGITQRAHEASPNGIDIPDRAIDAIMADESTASEFRSVVENENRLRELRPSTRRLNCLVD